MSVIGGTKSNGTKFENKFGWNGLQTSKGKDPKTGEVSGKDKQATEMKFSSVNSKESLKSLGRVEIEELCSNPDEDGAVGRM